MAPSHQDSKHWKTIRSGGEDPFSLGKIVFKVHLRSKKPVFDVNFKLISPSKTRCLRGDRAKHPCLKNIRVEKYLRCELICAGKGAGMEGDIPAKVSGNFFCFDLMLILFCALIVSPLKVP